MNYLKGSYTLVTYTEGMSSSKTYDTAYGLFVEDYCSRIGDEWRMVVGIFEDVGGTAPIVARASITNVISTDKTSDEIERDALSQMVSQSFPDMILVSD